MSDVLDKALSALQARLPNGFSSSAKFVLTGEGAIIADPDGVRIADDEAEVTLTASPETFRGILEGDINPTMAFMSGKLKVDGAMGVAMQLGAALS